MFKHNLAATLNTQRPDKKGLYPVRIRATIKRKVTYYPTGIMILKEHWSKDKRKVILHPKKNYYNTVIKDKISDLEKQFIEQALSGNDSLKIQPKKLTSFNTYAEKKIKAWESSQSISTIRHKYSYLKKFNDFKKVKLMEVTPALLQDYENYCRGLGNQHNTIWSAFKFIRTIIREALNDQVITKNPMKGYKVPGFKNPVRNYLTPDELLKVEEVAEKCPEEVYRTAANWFLFSCYCGLRYGDAKEFNKSKIIGGKIILRTEKTGTDLTIKVHPALQRVLDRMSKGLGELQYYNRSLKVVGVLAGLGRRITSHLARHTFAVDFLTRGGSMEVLSKLMGHSTIKTTEIYARIVNKRVDKEIDEFYK